MRCAICGSKNPRDPSGGWHEAIVRDKADDGKAIAVHRLCSWPCAELYLMRLRRRNGGPMIDLPEDETAAFAATLRPLGEFVAAVGAHKPLAEYTREEMLTLIEIAVTACAEHRRQATAGTAPDAAAAAG